MGSVDPYVTTSGRRYRVTYRRPDHRQTTKRGFRTKKDAELFLASVRSISRGTYIDPSKARVKLGDWLDGWLASRSDLRETTRERVVGIIEIHVRPMLGLYPIGELDHTSLQAWTAQLSRKQSAASVRKCVNVISGALQAAVADGRLPANPARGLKLPKVTTGRKRYLTHEDVQAGSRWRGRPAWRRASRTVPPTVTARWSGCSRCAACGGVRSPVCAWGRRASPRPARGPAHRRRGRRSAAGRGPEVLRARSVPVPQRLLEELERMVKVGVSRNRCSRAREATHG